MGQAQIRIFLGSPSADTVEARQQVAAVVREINADPKYERVADLRSCRWDDPDRPVACSADHNPQLDVNEQVADPGACDLVIGLFRHTMGGTLPEERFGRSPLGRLWYCTEWEVAQGLQGKRAGTVAEVWVYRDISEFASTADTARLRDLLRVAEYFDAFKTADGTTVQGFNPYKGPEDLARQLRHALRRWVDAYLGGEGPTRSARLARQTDAAAAPEVLTAAQQTLLDTLLRVASEGAALAGVPRDQIKAVLSEPVRGLRSYLLRRYAQWSTGAGGQLDRRFVNLTLMVDRGLEYDGERRVPDTRSRPDGRYDDLGELLAEHADVAAWVLVGDPGTGKSTLLQHHELVTAVLALQALPTTNLSDARPDICIWHRLSEYAADSPPPAQWLAERWAAQQPALPALPELQRQVRVRFLLDGLNEIRAPHREAQLAAIDRWSQWAAQNAGQGAAPLFSVRTLDQSPLGSGGQEVRQIILAPWTPEQMQQYCDAVLGPGNALWPAIKRDAAQLGLCRLPFNLVTQCELFAQLHRPARDHAELLSGMFWLLLRRRHDHDPMQAPGLLSAGDRLRLAGNHWKKALYALPREGCLVRWLDATGERMHCDGREVSLPRADLIERLQALSDGAQGSAAAEPAAWLRAVQGLGLLGEGEPDPYTGEPSLRYAHQLWQEFFAGRSLRELPARPAAERPDLRPQALVPVEQVLHRLGKQEPLPGPDPSHWEEAVKLAVQLSRDPVPWIRVLQPANLPLAARAAALNRTRLEAAAAGRQALDELRAALLQRSRDPAIDLRERIEAAEALGPLGDPRCREGCGPRGQRFLLPRPDLWVRVPAGPYVIGSDAPDRPDEQPATTVQLAAFDMAFAPLTNAEFACFIEAEGYDDERWWAGETAQRWRRGELRNEAEIERWRRIFADLRQDFDATVGRYPSLTEAQMEQWRQLADLPELEANARLEQWYGAARYRKPQEWHNPSFNQALQPVVGVTLFEAQAYTRWLAAQTGHPLALPTEAQWEAAARGAEGRTWPWGADDPTTWQINADPAHLRRSCPVGVFPDGDTPPGLTDMAGNVWEWTASAYTNRLQADALVMEAADGDALRAVRGGSWSSHTRGCRARYRNRGTPGGRLNNLGFRVVCCPILVP